MTILVSELMNILYALKNTGLNPQIGLFLTQLLGKYRTEHVLGKTTLLSWDVNFNPANGLFFNPKDGFLFTKTLG